MAYHVRRMKKMQQRKSDIRFTMRVPVDLRKRVKAVAEKKERTEAWVVKKCLERFLDKMELENSFNGPSHQPAEEDIELAA